MGLKRQATKREAAFLLLDPSEVPISVLVHLVVVARPRASYLYLSPTCLPHQAHRYEKLFQPHAWECGPGGSGVDVIDGDIRAQSPSRAHGVVRDGTCRVFGVNFPSAGASGPARKCARLAVFPRVGRGPLRRHL